MSGRRGRLTAFVKSQEGTLYALAQDATGKSMAEMEEMDWLNLYATAKLREEYYNELYDG